VQNAKTLVAFEEYAAAGLVRIVKSEEQENYFDVYGKPDTAEEYEELVRTLDRYGVWFVEAEVWNGEEWEGVDGVGMCAGYSDPCCPFQNCYVIEFMRQAIIQAVRKDGEH
jgi:hypothetical protein